MSDCEESMKTPQGDSRVWSSAPSTLLFSVLIFGLTAAVFWSALRNDFVDWDDDTYVYEEPRVLDGISWKGLRWASTAIVISNWHPLTLISLQLDAQLFGTGPYGFHRTAVLIHSLNAVLAFLTLKTLTGSVWKSLLVAMAFALHPFRVESVAWIAERKDVLSGLFFWLTVLAYAGYARSPSILRYVLVALAHAAGLSSKSMLVTTPCVLMLLDFWPLKRMSSIEGGKPVRLLNLVLEKVPLLGLSAAACWMAINSQQSAMMDLAMLPFSMRVSNSIVSVVAYLRQSFWPVDLSPLYPFHAVSTSQLTISVLILVAITLLGLWQRRKQPAVLVGWLWFLGMLVPVIGLIQVGNQSRADRYTYLPQIGLWIGVVWGLGTLAGKSKVATNGIIAVAAVGLCGFARVTIGQIPVWKDTESMWRQAYRLEPNNHLAAHHLAMDLYRTGNKLEGIRMTHEAIRTAVPSDINTLVEMAMMLADAGEYAPCVEVLNKALHDHPAKADLYSNRGKALAALNRWREAADDYRRAWKLAPAKPSYAYYLAHALRKLGQVDESRRTYESAIRLSPDWPRTAAANAWRMSTSSNPGERVNFWPVCLAEQANEATGEQLPEYLNVLAAAYANSDRFDDAIAVANRAIVRAESMGQKEAAEHIRKRLEFYERREPYRQITQ